MRRTAAQEAFARSWKALPRFAGERRFYPWLTVIAGNICTDMLRRRSRSTPTDDMELTAQHPVGVVGEDTSEELVLAAVDGELVNRALGRLSTRHRHVLAIREESGWTYQQIADHEGVEIGTIETLLWRARQALNREFAVVSESKEALAGFLIATGALLRRGFFRVAHRGASVHHQSGGAGEGLRNAMAGMAVTGAAVAAAFIAPHALSGAPSAPPGAPGSALAAPSGGLRRAEVWKRCACNNRRDGDERVRRSRRLGRRSRWRRLVSGSVRAPRRADRGPEEAAQVSSAVPVRPQAASAAALTRPLVGSTRRPMV